VVGLALMLAGFGLRSRLFTGPEDLGVDVEYRALHSTDDILEVPASRVPPVSYTRVVSLDELTVAEKKEAFFDVLLPSVLISMKKLARDRESVARLAAQPAEERSAADADWLAFMQAKYRADDLDDLQRRLVTHPPSIVLAQAAIESGWGTSRFFVQGLNVFGVWSFDADEPRMAARHRRGDHQVYVKRYTSLIESVDDYFTTIARGPYSAFRQGRTNTDDPLALVGHLERYSELGAEYVRRLRATIRANGLTRFDDARLVPDPPEGE